MGDWDNLLNKEKEKIDGQIVSTGYEPIRIIFHPGYTHAWVISGHLSHQG